MWKMAKLGELMEIARGGSPRPIKSYITDDEDGVNWIKIGDTEEGVKHIQSTKEKIKRSGISRSRYVTAGDFLLSNSMSFGRPYILKIDGCIHDGWLVLSNYESHFAADYLYYLLSSSVVKNQFETAARGSTVRNLNIELVSNVEVSYPPLAEQQRIVTKLDAAFAEIDEAIKVQSKRKLNVEQLIAKLQNQLFEKVSDINLKSLKDVSKFENGDRGKNYPSKKYQIDEGIPFVNAGDFSQTGEIMFDKMVYISEERFDLLGAGKFTKNDILFCLRGSLGKSALNQKIETGAIASSLVIIRADESVVLPDYLFAFLRSDIVKGYIEATAGGAAQPNLSAKVVSNYKIPLANLDEQRVIVKKYWSIREQGLALQAIIEQKIKALTALKSAILAEELRSEAA